MCTVGKKSGTERSGNLHVGRAAGFADDEIPDFCAQHPERQVAGIPEERHLEHVQGVDVGDGVHPLRVASEIPRFPEKAAEKGGEADRSRSSRGEGTPF